MLRVNPLQPPRPFVAGLTPAASRPAGRASFVAAEDYDSTGIMAGVDPSESRYWWLPELYAPEPAGRMPAWSEREPQATRRTEAATAAAA